MNFPPHTFEELHDRLLKLEKQNRRFKQLGAAVLTLPVLMLVLEQSPSKKTVEANEFILRDSGGHMPARLSMDEKFSDAQIVLFDRDSNEKVKIQSGSDLLHGGGTLKLSYEHGLPRVYASSNGSLGGTLSLLNEKGAPGTVLHTDFGNLPDVTIKVARTSRLALESDDNIIRGILSIGSDNEGSLSLMGADGKVSLNLGPKYVGFADSKGTPSAVFGQEGLYVVDSQGFATSIGATELLRQRTGETSKTSAAAIVLFDKNKNVIWKAP